MFCELPTVWFKFIIICSELELINIITWELVMLITFLNVNKI